MRKDGRLADRMLAILIAGVSRSEVCREGLAAGERLLQELDERDLSGLEILHWPWGIIGNYSAALRPL